MDACFREQRKRVITLKSSKLSETPLGCIVVLNGETAGNGMELLVQRASARMKAGSVTCLLSDGLQAALLRILQVSLQCFNDSKFKNLYNFP